LASDSPQSQAYHIWNDTETTPKNQKASICTLGAAFVVFKVVGEMSNAKDQRLVAMQLPLPLGLEADLRVTRSIGQSGLKPAVRCAVHECPQWAVSDILHEGRIPAIRCNREPDGAYSGSGPSTGGYNAFPFCAAAVRLKPILPSTAAMQSIAGTAICAPSLC
jgi:hypothetical protein